MARAPNGSSQYRRTGGSRPSTARRTSGKKRAKTPVKRAVAGAKRKAATLARAPAKTAVKNAVIQNTMALNSVFRKVQQNTRRLDGVYQTITGVSPQIILTAATPTALHLNNLNIGAKTNGHPAGPQWFQASDNEPVAEPQYLGVETRAMPIMKDQRNKAHPHATGPKCKWLGTELQFKFEGFLDDTRVKIFIVQELRKYKLDPWQQYTARQSNHVVSDDVEMAPHMPYTINQWKNILGFNANKVNYKQYKVIATRSLYFNSRRSEAPSGTVEGDNGFVDATTKPVQYCSIKIKPNKMLYQLRSTYNEMGVHDDITDPAPADADYDQGPWSFDNQDPHANWWAIVTTDDESALGGTITGDRVKFTCIRRNWWQDQIGPTMVGTGIGSNRPDQ